MTDRNLHIVLAVPNLFLGGAQQLVVTLARHLPAFGMDVTVLDLVGGRARLGGTPEPLRDAVLGTGARLVDFHVRSALDFGEWRRATHWMRATAPDVVHGHLVPTDRWAAVLAARAGVPALTTKHDTYGDATLRARLTEAAAYRLLFARVIAISGATQQHLQRRYFVPESKLAVVPNPVDAAAFERNVVAGAAVRAELGIPHDSFTVGYLGRLVERKGLDVWLRAAAECARRVPGARFVIVGYGPDESALRALAARLGIADSVRFVGPRADVAACLSAFDALLFTPLWGEGLPIAVLEAMAAGLPVVASNIGAHRELLSGVGILPEPSDWAFETRSLAPEPFGMALAELAQSPEARVRLGEAARLRVLERYDVPVAVARQADLYRSVARRG